MTYANLFDEMTEQMVKGRSLLIGGTLSPKGSNRETVLFNTGSDGFNFNTLEVSHEELLIDIAGNEFTIPFHVPHKMEKIEYEEGDDEICAYYITLDLGGYEIKYDIHFLS